MTVHVPVAVDERLLVGFVEQAAIANRDVKIVEPDPEPEWLVALHEAQADLDAGRFTRHVSDDDLLANGFPDDDE